jgi:hypothetical protein
VGYNRWQHVLERCRSNEPYERIVKRVESRLFCSSRLLLALSLRLSLWLFRLVSRPLRTSSSPLATSSIRGTSTGPAASRCADLHNCDVRAGILGACSHVRQKGGPNQHWTTGPAVALMVVYLYSYQESYVLYLRPAALAMSSITPPLGRQADP